MYKKLSVLAGLSLITALVIGCSTLQPLNNISELQDDEVVVVGRIELDPPLDAEYEQNFSHSIGAGKLKDGVVLVLGNNLLDVTSPSMSNSSNYAMAPLGKDFYIRVPKGDKLIFSGASILVEASTGDSIYLPGGIELVTKPNDRAIYMGTIRYHRDDFNGIKDVKFINDYKSASKQFSKKFGNKVKLRRIELKEATS